MTGMKRSILTVVFPRYSAAQNAAAKSAEDLIKVSDCSSCHAVDHLSCSRRAAPNRLVWVQKRSVLQGLCSSRIDLQLQSQLECRAYPKNRGRNSLFPMTPSFESRNRWSNWKSFKRVSKLRREDGRPALLLLNAISSPDGVQWSAR
jgi:hypothetical protein